MSKDIIRQSLNLVLAPGMWICSSLGFVFEGARSPAEMSDTNTSLLVPSGIAFSIWFPIFVLCISYGVIQALPKNRTREVYRKIGGWSAAGFAGICAWGVTNAFAPMQPVDYAQWGTAIIFVPTMLLLVKAMLVATREKDRLNGFEKIAAWGGLSMIAGWCSIAVFLNWAPQTVSLAGTFGISGVITNGVILLLALAWAVVVIRKSGANRAYAFPILWGTAFIIVKRLSTDPVQPVIIGLAAFALCVLIAAAVIKPKTYTTQSVY